MAFKDIIPWRRGREVPVQRTGQQPGVGGDDAFLAPFFRQTQDLFESFFQGFGGLMPRDAFGGLFGERGFGPSLCLDLTEKDDRYHVAIELPGVDEEDVEVLVADGALTVRGEKRTESESDAGDVHRMERSYGRFERSVPLPAEIDEEKVTAEFRKGVLHITLPKTEKAKARTHRIPIRFPER